AELHGPWFNAAAEGVVAPTPALTVSGATHGGEARLNGSVRTGPGGVAATGTLTTEPLALGPISLPAVALALGFTPHAGLTLAGAPHSRTGELSGWPAAPGASLQLSGPLLAGNASFAAGVLSAELGVTITELLPPQLPLGSNLTEVQLHLSAEPGGAWTAAAA